MKRVRWFMAVVAAALALTMGLSSALACSPMGAGKDATVDGSVMVAHTCDGWYDARVIVIPGGTHAEGEVVEIYNDPCVATRPYVEIKKVGEIPQAAETYTYFQVGYPFMNEKQVMIGEHTWSGRSEMYTQQGIMMIANIEAIGLARAATAKDCIKVMGEMAEKYGYVDGGEALIVGDTEELWYFEICGAGPLWTPDCGKPGAHWAAVRIPDDEFIIAANRSRIGKIDFDDPENYMWSTDITAFPQEMGWWNPGEDFIYYKMFDNPSTDYSMGLVRREWRGFSLVAPSQNFSPTQSRFPLSVKPDQKLSLKDMFAIYCDHMEGTPYDQTQDPAAGPYHNPHKNGVPRDLYPASANNGGWERKIAVWNCSYSFVSQSRGWLPDPVGGVLWYGCDSPDTTVRVPIYCGATTVPEQWSNIDRQHLDLNSAWWAFQFVNNWATLRWDAIYEEICEERDKYQDRFIAEMPELEAEVTALYAEDPAKAVERVTEYTNAAMDEVYHGWWAFAAKLVGEWQDGGRLNAEGRNQSVGYPTEWLEAHDFGITVSTDRDAIKASLGIE